MSWRTSYPNAFIKEHVEPFLVRFWKWNEDPGIGVTKNNHGVFTSKILKGIRFQEGVTHGCLRRWRTYDDLMTGSPATTV